MLLYSDAFSCTINNKTKSLVLNFSQNEPVINEKGETIIQTNNVASILLEKETAVQFLATLNNIHTKTSTEDAE